MFFIKPSDPISYQVLGLIPFSSPARPLLRGFFPIISSKLF